MIRSPIDLNKASVNFLEPLIAFSSVFVLGIWSVGHTIFLRNALLIAGALLCATYLSIKIMKREYRHFYKAGRILPYALLISVFVWVIFRNFLTLDFGAVDSDKSISTWLRCFGGVLLGFTTGIIFVRRKWFLPFLWAGVLLSFLYLLAQYLPKAISTRQILVYDPFNYIYLLKINGVLMGVLMLSGLAGGLIDGMKCKKDFRSLKLIYCLIGIYLALYSFVFIFNARNGVGVTLILLVTWQCYMLVYAYNQTPLFSSGFAKAKLLFFLPIFLLTLYHFAHNPTWVNLLGDIKNSSQVEKYTHWQNEDLYGIPSVDLGKKVTPNVYDRVALATVGIGLIPKHPLGAGTLDRPFVKLLALYYPDAKTSAATHSGWIDFTLSYGIPGIVLLLSPLVIIIFFALRGAYRSNGFVLLTSFGVFILYAIGELGSGHGLEVLFYVIAFLSALHFCNDS